MPGSDKGFYYLSFPLVLLLLITVFIVIPVPNYHRVNVCPDKPINESVNDPECIKEQLDWEPSIISRVVSQFSEKGSSPEIITIAESSSEITASWGDYHNEKLGFQFKYPDELDIVNEGSDRFSFFLGLTLSDNVEKIKTYDVNIVISQDEKSRENMEFCFENAGTVKEGKALNRGGNILSIKNSLLILDGQEACLQQMTSENKLVYNALLERNGNVYTIQFLAEGDTGSIYNLNTQILSTFKFINS